MFNRDKKPASTLNKIADNLKPINEIASTGAAVGMFAYYAILISQALKQPDYIQKNLNSSSEKK